MNQLDRLKKSLEESYGINIDDFLVQYTDGITKEEMMAIHNCTSFKLRQIASTLNLRWASRYRASDYQLMLTREDSDTTGMADEIIKLQEDVVAYEHELGLRDRALVRTRREANRLRKTMREEAVEDVITGIVADAVADLKNVKGKLVPTPAPTMDGTDFILLSDIHAGATVVEGDVPDNQFSWEIMERRLSQLFMQAAANLKNNHLHLYLLGDMVDGIIHDSLESADKSPAEAVKDLAALLSAYILAFVDAYETVSVYCLNGNHSRLSENIKRNAKGFDLEFLLYSIMEAQLGSAVSHFELSTTGMIAAEVGVGVFAGLHHGDNFRGSGGMTRDLQIQERFRQIGQDVSHLIQGHTHIYESRVMNTGGFAITNGSVIGTNGYVHTSGLIPVPAVQVLGSWDLDGQLDSITPVIL